MPNLITLKNNEVTAIVFNIEADTAMLRDDAKVGDIYDPITDTFKSPAPPAQPTLPEPPLQEGGNPEEPEF